MPDDDAPGMAVGEIRQQADYGYGTIDENGDALLARTHQFVSEMESPCPSID